MSKSKQHVYFFLWLAFLLFLGIEMVAAKDKNKFKACAKLPFCSMHRNQKEAEPAAVRAFSIFY